ncbi:hypothetical protein [Streptomyces agglomeratus]|uniref:hypothetical protein n=1 Tax=Streptomyces agglomeratus TaxID=285458 RepID=UPI00114CEA81|nr:hypothetical protein [Streptomyces agglomeratus]
MAAQEWADLFDSTRDRAPVHREQLAEEVLAAEIAQAEHGSQDAGGWRELVLRARSWGPVAVGSASRMPGLFV